MSERTISLTDIEQHILSRFRDMVAKKSHGQLVVEMTGGKVTRCVSQYGDEPQVLKELQAA